MYDSIKAKAFKEVRDADPEYMRELVELRRISKEDNDWFDRESKARNTTDSDTMKTFLEESRIRHRPVMEQARKVDRIQVRIARELGFDVSNLGIIGLANAGVRDV